MKMNDLMSVLKPGGGMYSNIYVQPGPELPRDVVSQYDGNDRSHPLENRFNSYESNSIYSYASTSLSNGGVMFHDTRGVMNVSSLAVFFRMYIIRQPNQPANEELWMVAAIFSNNEIKVRRNRVEQRIPCADNANLLYNFRGETYRLIREIIGVGSHSSTGGRRGRRRLLFDPDRFRRRI